MQSSGIITDRSGTVTAGGTAQTVMSTNPTRKYFFFMNLSNSVMWLNWNGVAAADSPSIPIAAASSDGATDGGVYAFESEFCPQNSLSLFCATTAEKFICKEG